MKARVLFVVVLMIALSVSSRLCAQKHSIGMNPDGSGWMGIQNGDNGEETVFPLSEKTFGFVLNVAVEEFIDAGIRGNMTYNRFQGDEKEVALYQAALEMTPEQIARLALKQNEVEEGLSSTAYQSWERLPGFDALSEENAAALEVEFRDSLRYTLELQQAALDEVLTPQQKQTLNEMELFGGLSSSPKDALCPNLNAYHALDLSEGQQTELDKIHDEFRREIQGNTLSLLEDFKAIAVKINNAREISKEEQEKLMTELSDVMGKRMEKSLELKNRITARVHGILTPEQLARFEKIVAEWPAKMEKLQEEWQAREDAKKPEDDEWKKSWNPGDPVPEGAVPPRSPRKAFPMM